MGAFDVIGKNLQLRLGVNHRVVGQQQIAVGLFGVGFLRVLADQNFPVEDAMGAVRQNAVIKFVAFAMRPGVVHHGMMVNQLFGIAQSRGR